MKLNKLSLLLLTLGLALSLVACGQSATPAATSTPKPMATHTTPDAAENILGGSPEPTPQVEPAALEGLALLFRDDFEGELGTGWIWQRQDPSLWNLADAPGFLRINLSPAAFGTASNVLLRDAPAGDFEIATMVRFTPTGNFQFAGLLVYQDDSNALQFGRAFCTGSDVCVGNAIYFDNIQSEELVGPNYATPTASQSRAYLRLRREGTTYTGYYSEDGANWTVIGQHKANLRPVSVGLVAAQALEGPADADFDYFALSGAETVASAPTPTLTPTQALTPTPAPSPTPMSSPTPAPSPTPMASPTPLAPPRRLPTGTVIREAGARNGLGELRIENGHQLDAVAVVSDLGGSPLIAVYIQSSDTFAITGIQDGTYQLYFSLGEDWDGASARFTRRAEFFRFEESLPFATTPTPQGQQYTIFQVTLHFVEGGTVPVESLPEGQFPDL